MTAVPQPPAEQRGDVAAWLDRCPAVQFDGLAVTRCTKPVGHAPNQRGDVWHSGSGRYIDEDGEPDVYGTAWRDMPALAAAHADGTSEQIEYVKHVPFEDADQEAW